MLSKTYDPKAYEGEIYKRWEASGLFAPSKDGEPYSIVLPPPNATGQLHLGHVVMIAIEDSLIRYQRMRGRSALWVAGTDHAAIATNAVMERELAGEGKTKHDIGREAFLKRLGDYVENSRGTIRSQVKAMGGSLDWQRERYTMEPAMNRIVEKVFIKMHQDGLIYRGNRIVNWDPNLETTVSDDEVERKEEKATFYVLKYGPFEIGTARPETKFGDKYVVMHPDDKRYAKYKHGETFEAEWINGPVKATVIKDEAVDPAFGTGVMTITPWHDTVDFEIAERHKLDKQQIIGLDGKLLAVAGEFAGQTIEQARPAIIAKLKKKGLVVSENTNYVHSLALNYRGKGLIEPQIMPQWFVDVNKAAIDWKDQTRSFKEVMKDVVESGDVEIMPARFNKLYYHWIDNLRDWCISRQIWWGHRIPAWYKGDEIFVGSELPAEHKKDKAWKQDEDTLDTWFSSATWTWSTLIDPEIGAHPELSLEEMLKQSPDFQRFHPTSVLETAADILFFWVARMILMTTYVTGQIPFEKVYLHGLILDRNGQKMSKSHPETAIDPLTMTDKYGADALRLSMMIGQAPGANSRLYEEKIAGARNFNNKLWNVARFIIDKLPEGYQAKTPTLATPADHWIDSQLQTAIEGVTSAIDQYRFSDATTIIYHLLWDDFADWYIEASKQAANLDLLVAGLETICKLAHPFVPFVTEAIWQALPHRDSMLLGEQWPEIHKTDTAAAQTFEQLKALVGEIRNLRGELQLTENWLYHKGSPLLRDHAALIQALSGVQGVREVSDGHGLHLTSIADEAWLDVEEQITRGYLMKLVRRRDEQRKFMEAQQTRLSNSDYLAKAPKQLVEETRRSLAETEALVKKLDQQIDGLEHELQLYG